jgi:general secretion pathway protein A
VAVGVFISGASVLLTYGQIRFTASGAVQSPGKPPAEAARPAVEARAAPAATPEAPPPEPVKSAAEPQAPAPKTPGLGELLLDPGLRGDKKSAFASLYSRWRLDFDASKHALGCERGRPEGLQCLFKTGTWAKLRRFNLPAIIELSSAGGDRSYATVVALDEQSATLDLGGRRYTFPLSEIDLYWDGPFILLWKAPKLTSLPIAPGARGKDVEWVRLRLSELDGAPPGGKNRDVFDEELRSRVVAFQRARALTADGIVGEETLTHLVSAQRDPSVPRLWRAGS